MPLEVVFVKKIQLRYPLDFWRTHFRDPPLVTWFYS